MVDTALLQWVPLARACDTMLNKCFFTIYIGHFGRRFAFTLHCAALCTTPKTTTPKTTTPIITFKAVSENVRNCILFLSVEK